MAAAEEAFASSERQIVHGVEVEDVRLIIICTPVIEMLVLVVKKGRYPGLIFAIDAGITRADVVEGFLKGIVGLQ